MVRLVYDVGHNNAKFEDHEVGGRSKKVLVHREGATRAFPPGHPAIPGILRKMEKHGVLVACASSKTLAEEIPEAYKDVSAVAVVVENAGIARKVARLRPLAVVKG